jgi:hypothetical protein
MPSPVVALALRDAVAAALNDPVGVLGLAAPGWSQTFTAETCYAPDLELADVKELRVLVGAQSRRQGLLNRKPRSQVDVAVGIGVFRQVAAGADNPDKLDQDAVAALVLLEQEFTEAFAAFHVASPAFQVFQVENDPLYDVEQLAGQARFAGVVVLTFRGSR